VERDKGGGKVRRIMREKWIEKLKVIQQEAEDDESLDVASILAGLIASLYRDLCKQRADDLEIELAGYKTRMECGHPRAATVVEDPPYCAICRIVKERDDWKNAFYKALGSISDASKRQRVYESLRWH
jgi:hypothetical protein